MLVMAAVATAAAADDPDPRIVAGFAGAIRTGSWTPLVVEPPEGVGEGVIRVQVEDADGQWVEMPPAPRNTGDGGPPTARVTARFGRPQARVRMAAGHDGREFQVLLAPPAPATEAVLLVLGDLPSIDRAARLLAAEDRSRPRIVAMPDDTLLAGLGPRDLDGADVIVVCGRAIAGRDAGVVATIDGWVRRGGRLVLLAGTSAADVARQPVAATWLPGPIERMVPLRRTAAIETFARSPRPLDKAAVAGLTVPLFAHADALDGVVDVHDGPRPSDLPLVVRRAHGLGTIAWIGIDLDAGAFRTWPGTDAMLVDLVGRAAGAAKRAGAGGRAGETDRQTLDLAGQLRRAIDLFPGVRPVPFELVSLLGIVIVACLYPLDWWLSRTAPPARAWLTLPLLALGLTGAAWGMGRRWHGDAWHRSGASVVDIDAVSGLARGTSWAGVWSPVNAAIDVGAAPSAALSVGDAETAISWWADSGRGIGAVDAPVAHPSLATTPYAYGPSLATLVGVPIAASSSRLFEGEWVAALPVRAATSDLIREAQGTLRGSCAHHLPFPLEQCVLAHAGWLYDVGRLEPGMAFDPAAVRGPRSLAAAITRRTQSKDRDVAVRWDVSATDAGRILEIAGLHGAAGGSGYTSLDAGRLSRLDLSPLLDVDRAVLIGLGPPGTDWQIAARPPHAAAGAGGPASSPVAVWRIVMPLTTVSPRTSAP